MVRLGLLWCCEGYCGDVMVIVVRLGLLWCCEGYCGDVMVIVVW